MGHPETLLIVSSGNNPAKCTKSSQFDGKTESNNDSENKNIMDILDFQSKELTVFPLADIANNGVYLTRVNIDYNKISLLPEKISEQLPMLQVFTANGNELSILPDEFGDFSHLHELCLCDNNLISLPESLSNLAKLRVLKLNANCLMRLPAEIGQNKSLEVLSVDENRLKRFPATLGLLKNLCVLEANSNVLEHLPNTLNYLESLRVVDLSNNRLSHIPEPFGELKSLTHIDLSENRISHLCDNFQSTRTLQRLYLDHNAFSRCPQWFKDLDNIVEIRMKCNKLSSLALPEGFGLRSVQLKILDLRGNSIQKLPISFGHLISLESLLLGTSSDCLEKSLPFLNGNWLSTLPSNFAELIFLRQLHLEDSQLRSLPDDIGKLVHLEDLFLGSNMLFELPPSFTQLAALKRCQLSKNRLMKIPEDVGALEMLTALYLDFNKLKTLPASLKNLATLEVLDLSNNRLKQWPSDMISAMTRLKSLNLCHNRFTVPDCDIPSIIPKMHIAEHMYDCNTINCLRRQKKLQVLRPSAVMYTSECLEEDDTSKAEDAYSNCSRFGRIHDSDDWEEETDNHSFSSSSTSADEISNCQQGLVESWDVDSEPYNNGSSLGSGQFDLDDDDDEPVGQMLHSASSRPYSYGNCSHMFHLDIHRHLSTPYLYHVPTMKSFLYVPGCAVPGQFDNDIVSDNTDDFDIVNDNSDGNDIVNDNSDGSDIVNDNTDGSDVVSDNTDTNDIVSDNTDSSDFVSDNSNGNDIVSDAVDGIVSVKDNADKKDIDSILKEDNLLCRVKGL